MAAKTRRVGTDGANCGSAPWPKDTSTPRDSSVDSSYPRMSRRHTAGPNDASLKAERMTLAGVCRSRLRSSSLSWSGATKASGYT